MIRYCIIVFLFVSTVFGQYRDIPEVVTKVATSTANWLRLETSARAIAVSYTHLTLPTIYSV